jgi:hypothetical protein
VQVTFVAGFLEPLKYTLDKSESWGIALSLQSKGKRWKLKSDSDTDAEGRIIGISPLAQPVRVETTTGNYVLQFVKFVIRLNAAAKNWGTNTDIPIYDGSGVRRGLLRRDVSLKAYGSPRLFSAFFVSDSLSMLSENDREAFAGFVRFMTHRYWSKEPISWTSDKFSLTSDGQLMHPVEIERLNLTVGSLVVRDGQLSLQEGVSMTKVSYGSWRRAGVSLARQRRKDAKKTSGSAMMSTLSESSYSTCGATSSSVTSGSSSSTSSGSWSGSGSGSGGGGGGSSSSSATSSSGTTA